MSVALPRVVIAAGKSPNGGEQYSGIFVPHGYAERVVARLKVVSERAGVPCTLLATIRPEDVDVSKAMSLARACHEPYAEVFSTRSAAD